VYGQDPVLVSNGETPPPGGEGPIIIIEKTTVGDSGDETFEVCHENGSFLFSASIYLPVPLPSITRFNAGSRNLMVSRLTPGEFGSNDIYNECSKYKYDFSVYLRYPGEIPCGNSVIITIPFFYSINGRCLNDHFDSIGFPKCFPGDCYTHIMKIRLCSTPCDSDDESELEKRSILRNSNSIWPNPFTNSISFDSSEEVNLLELFDISGRLIITTSISSTNNRIIRTEDINSGVYILKLTYLNGLSKSFRMIKK